MKRHLPSRAAIRSVILALFVVVGTVAHADPQANIDYTILSADRSPPATGSQMEITEIFWYGCHFCQDFEPILKSWVVQHRGTVTLSRLPAALSPLLLPGAKTYYALKDLGLLSKYHERLLVAARTGQVDTTDRASIFRWFSSQGVDLAKFKRFYGSKRVARQVERARKRELGYEVVSIPTIVVNGRYLTSTRMARGYRAALKVVDYLLNRTS